MNVGMVIISILLFIGALIVGDTLSEDYPRKNGGVIICSSIVVGMVIYWTHKLWLIPIVEMFAPVDNKLLFLSVAFILIATDYAWALVYQENMIVCLGIAFVLNVILGAMAPLVATAITFIFIVSVYGAIQKSNVVITPLESSLLKTMVLIDTILTVLNLIGIVPGIILLLLIIAIATIPMVSIEFVFWKKTRRILFVNVNRAKQTGSNLPTALTQKRVKKN